MFLNWWDGEGYSEEEETLSRTMVHTSSKDYPKIIKHSDFSTEEQRNP